MSYLSPTQGYATASDFARWQEQAEQMTDAQLHFAAKDCRAAEQAMRGWNPVREGYYSDQACTFGDELRRRRMKR